MPYCFRTQNFSEIGQSVDELWPKKWISRWRSPPSWILKISIFSNVTVTGFNTWRSVPNFIKIGRFFRKICWFNDFQNGGCPPSWILHIYIFCPVALVGMPFCFLIQNFAEIERWIGRWVMAKKANFKMAAAAILNSKNCNFWLRNCNRVHYLT